MNNLEYKTVYDTTTVGKHTLGIQILVSSSVPVNMQAEKIYQALFDAGESIASEIQAEVISKDPDALTTVTFLFVMFIIGVISFWALATMFNALLDAWDWLTASGG